MSAADVRALVAAWQAGDEQTAITYFAPDAVYHEARKAPLAGHAAILAHWGAFLRGGPAWRMTVHEFFGSGDRCALTYTWEVQTAAGDWRAQPGCAILQLRGGKITLWREYQG